MGIGGGLRREMVRHNTGVDGWSDVPWWGEDSLVRSLNGLVASWRSIHALGITKSMPDISSQLSHPASRHYRIVYHQLLSHSYSLVSIDNSFVWLFMTHSNLHTNEHSGGARVLREVRIDNWLTRIVSSHVVVNESDGESELENWESNEILNAK